MLHSQSGELLSVRKRLRAFALSQQRLKADSRFVQGHSIATCPYFFVAGEGDVLPHPAPGRVCFCRWPALFAFSLSHTQRGVQRILLHSRREWSAEESATLARVVEQHMALLSARSSGRQASEVFQSVPWAEIAKCVPGRAAHECRAHWLDSVDPRVNRTPWSEAESKRLREVAEERPDADWSKVAAALGTNRTPWACAQRYQAMRTQLILDARFTEEDDALLGKLVERYAAGGARVVDAASVDERLSRRCGDRNWQLVAALMGRRKESQVMNRWLKRAQPRLSKGSWSPEEDSRLRLAVAAFGERSWNLVQQCVPTRTDVQCRDHYLEVMRSAAAPARSWSEEEDNRLLALAEANAWKWSTVAIQLGLQRSRARRRSMRAGDAHSRCAGTGRTDNQCWRRWKSIASKDQRERAQAAAAQRRSIRPKFAKRLVRPRGAAISLVTPGATPAGAGARPQKRLPPPLQPERSAKKKRRRRG